MDNGLNLPELVKPYGWQILPIYETHSAWLRLVRRRADGSLAICDGVTVVFDEATTRESARRDLVRAAQQILSKPGMHVYQPPSQWPYLPGILSDLEGIYGPING